MGSYEIHDKAKVSFSKLLVAGLTFLVIFWDISQIAHGKSVKYRQRRQGQRNNSKRHYVVTEEEIQDTYFIPHQQSYPVLPHYPVPVIIPVSHPSQPEAKKPKPKHANEHKEEHVLFQPPKTENDNDEHAMNGKNTGSSGNSGTLHAGEHASNTGEHASHIGEHASHTGEHALHTGEHASHNGEHASHTGEHASHTGEHASHNGEHALHTGEHASHNEKQALHNGEDEILENSDTIGKHESSYPALKHVTSNDVRKVAAYRNVGCYKDALPRAVPLLEGSDPILNEYYKTRLDAVDKCAHVAKSRGYQVFTIQNGGFCSSGPMAHKTFQIYGPASNCRSGTGGKWESDVYIFNVYEYELTVHTGIEQKSSTDANVSVALYGVMGSSRHIPLRSHASTIINDPFQSGQVDKFMVHTVPLGDLTRLHVCLDNTGSSPEWYLEQIAIKDQRNKIFIFPCNCWFKRRKKENISERNLLPAVVIDPGSFKYIGCFKHPKSTIVISHEYKIQDGRPSTATFPNKKPNHKDYVIETCAQASYARGFMFFGIHNREKCVSSAGFQDIYDKYGRAYDCLTTGTGAIQSVAVYTFSDREPLPIGTNGATENTRYRPN